MFISFNVELATPEGATAALDALRTELEAKGVPVKAIEVTERRDIVDNREQPA